MELHHIALMFYLNTLIIISLETGSSPIVQITLHLHIFQTMPFGLFNWVNLKDKVYAYNPETIDALKNNILTEIRIPHDMLDRVIKYFNVQYNDSVPIRSLD